MPECPYLQWPVFRRAVVAAFANTKDERGTVRNSPVTAGTAGGPSGSHLSLAHPPKHMRQASAEYRSKPHGRRDHGQNRRAGEAVMLESRGRIDEHYTVDGECRGGDGENKRDDARDDGQHSALLSHHRGAIIRRSQRHGSGQADRKGRLLRTGP
jgi:hypothetical protein